MNSRVLIQLLFVSSVALGGVWLSGCQSIKEVCRDSCTQQRDCDDSFSQYGYTVNECRSECEDDLEQALQDVSDDCSSATLDYTSCVANRSCGEWETQDYSSCASESETMNEKCAGEQQFQNQ